MTRAAPFQAPARTVTFKAPSPAAWIDRALLPARGCRVWLPAGYDQQPQRRYPTLYVHDGQCCLSTDSDSGGGELGKWGLNSVLARLITNGEIRAPIVVLVDSCGRGHPLDMDLPLGPEMPAVPLLRQRWVEYGDNPLGRRYISYLCDDLKPAIDARFRTLPSPEHTAAMGSSMGGLCAFLSAWRRPDVFAHAACLSPVFQLPLITEVATHRQLRPDARLYIDNGGDTHEHKVPLIELADGLDPIWQMASWHLDTSLQPGIDALCSALRMQRVPFEYYREAGGRHNARAWGRRVERPLRVLLPPGR